MSQPLAGSNRRRGTLAAAAAVVVVLLLVGIVVMLRDPAPPQASPQPSVASPAATAASTSEVGPDFTWVDRQGVDLPVSRQAGPTEVDGARASGFAASQLGAVLAAAHITWQAAANAGPDVYEPTLDQQVVGPSAPALRASTRAEYASRRAELGVPAGQPLGRSYAEMRGYRVESYESDRAVVHLLMTGPAVPGRPSTFDFRTTLEWTDGDWKLQAPPGGRWESVTTPADEDASGYTALRKDG